MLDAKILDSHDYALIDPMTVDAVPSELPVIPFVPFRLKKDAHLLPLLLPLRNLPAEARDTLLEDGARAHTDGRAPLVSTLLVTSDAPDRLCGHLAERLLIRLSRDEYALLRYYDPRVFVQLQWILPKSQLRALFGPISSWSVLLDGEWSSSPSVAVERAVWAMDKGTRERLARIGMINQTLARIPRPWPASRLQLGQQIDRVLAQATDRYQFEYDEDWVNFALHALSVNLNFDRHSLIQSLIRRIADEGQSYTDASALLSDSDWQRIDRELMLYQGLST